MAIDKDHTVDIITMGCSKNLVDSERLIRMFEREGFKVFHNPEKLTGKITIINTCGFIGDAKQESIDMILQCCQKKKRRKGKVYVTGCLSQRYAEELPSDIPEVDGWYGKFDWEKVIEDLTQTVDSAGNDWERTLTTPSHYAYVKIAEGCDRHCAYCAIPIITGRYKSRPIEEIIEETKDLVAKGVTELNVIAQDLTYYGIDIYGKQEIARLVDEMAKVEGVKRIRLHYAYPTHFPYELLQVMAKHKNVCNYLDIALQHISDNVLSNMQRNITSTQTRALLKRMREEVPGIHIRTTLMVGFPGEGEKEFEELKEFVREQRFERLGAFAYCEEDDTFAAKNFDDDIPQDVKDARLDEIMALQQEIALELNEDKIGRTYEVVIDSENDDYYIGRTEFDSPDVDPEVLVVKDKKLEIGGYYMVKITHALPYELIGEAMS